MNLPQSARKVVFHGTGIQPVVPSPSLGTLISSALGNQDGDCVPAMTRRNTGFGLLAARAASTSDQS